MILGMGAMAVKAPRKVSEACGVNRGYNIPTLCQTLGLSLALLLCLCVSSWGACYTSNSSIGQSGTNPIPCVCDRVIHGACPNPNQTNECTLSDGGILFRCGNLNSSVWPMTCPYTNILWKPSDSKCIITSFTPNPSSYLVNVTTKCCDTQAEADSVLCEQNPTLPQCGPQNDTETMDQLESRCNAIDGVAHYQFNDQGNVVGYCDICQTDENGNYTNRFVKANYDDYKSSCCQVGKAPNKSDFKCNSSANACTGADCDWFNGVGGGGIGYSQQDLKTGICAVNISLNADGTIQGCEDDSEEINSSDSENPNSSSSDIPASGSSASQDSVGMDENVAAIAQGVGEILDSLHKIIVIDSMNRTYDSLVAVFTSTIASLVDEINQKEFGGGDTTIINVPRDTNIVNVNVGQAAVVSAIESMSTTQQATAQAALAKSDTTNDILRGILGALQQGDTSSVYNDSNIVNILTDTTGQSYGDTAGWGAKFDSIGTWLKDSTILKNIFGSGSGALCDTTGGKKCASMGGSLDSASGSWGSTYKALGDSLTGGAVGDSLRHWESMLTNNGVISGSGSNSCPSVFSRQHTINIGSGIEVQTPALGQYVCATIPGTSITFWTLARVVIRAMVAITCMWWLYGAVTGVKSDGGDDD